MDPHTSVQIPVTFVYSTVDGLVHKQIIPIMTEAFINKTTSSFQNPFYHYWQPTPDSPLQRVYDKIYTTDKHIKMHEEINALPRAAGDDFERVVVPSRSGPTLHVSRILAMLRFG